MIEYPYLDETIERPTDKYVRDLRSAGMDVWSDFFVDRVRLTWRELAERRTVEMNHYRDRADRRVVELADYIPQLDDLVEFPFTVKGLILTRLQGIIVAIGPLGVVVQTNGLSVLVDRDMIVPVEMTEEVAVGDEIVDGWLPSVGDEIILTSRSEAALQLGTIDARIIGITPDSNYFLIERRDGQTFTCVDGCGDHPHLFASFDEIARRA